MSKVKMTANDTVHISAAGPDTLVAGQEFEVDSSFAEEIEKRGLATRSGDTKSEAPVENKMEEPPVNKAAPPLSSDAENGSVDPKPPRSATK